MKNKGSATFGVANKVWRIPGSERTQNLSNRLNQVQHNELDITLSEWLLCMITSDQVSFVSKTLRICTIFNDSASGIHLCKTCKLFNFKTRLGDEICSSYKNMRKGH